MNNNINILPEDLDPGFRYDVAEFPESTEINDVTTVEDNFEVEGIQTEELNNRERKFIKILKQLKNLQCVF